MKTSKIAPKPRQLTAVELIAIGLLFIAIRLISGQLSTLLLEQFTLSSPEFAGQESLHVSAPQLSSFSHIL